MVAIAAWHFSEERTDARSHVEERTREVARLIASRADEFVRRSEVSLQAAALMIRVDPPDIRYNDSVLKSLVANAMGGTGSLNVQAVGGGNIGTTIPLLAANRSLPIIYRRYYAEALKTGTFAVGEPVRGRPDTTQWIMS